MKVYSYTIQGKRDSNEDQHVAYLNLDGEESNKNNINFFAVFDGHGGKAVSKYLKENLPVYFMKKFDKNIFVKPDKFSKYVNKVYDLMQDNLKKNHPRAANYCGSTACVSIMSKEDKKTYLWMVNVGDSRGILCNKDGLAVQLSKDHKPNTPEERTRIEQLGGKDYIKYDGVDWRVKDLSLSRAFGDLECCPYVSHLPQIYRYKVSSEDKFLIKACDGLWDVLSNQDAVDYVLDLKKNNFKGNFSKALCDHAYNKGSLDNVTVIVYFF